MAKKTFTMLGRRPYSPVNIASFVPFLSFCILLYSEEGLSKGYLSRSLQEAVDMCAAQTGGLHDIRH